MAFLEASVLLGILGGLCALYLLALGGPKFRLDDAYIVLNNAQALRAPDTSFPETPALHGSTSLLHTLAAALVAPVFGMELGLMVLAWGAIGLNGLGILQLTRQAELPRYIGVAVVACALTTGDLVQVYLNGLETGLAMAVLTWLIVLHRGGGRALPFLAAAAPFVRPELALLSALVLAGWCLRGERHAEAPPLLRAGLAFSSVFIGLLLLQYWASGSLLPTTGDAKKYFFITKETGFFESSAIGATQVFLFFLLMLPQSLFLLGLVRRRSRLYVLFAAVFLGYYMVFQPLTLHQNFYRYMYLLLPLCFLGAIELASSKNKGIRAFSTMMILVVLVLNVKGAAVSVPAGMETVRAKYETLSDAADWIDRVLEPSETVLIHDVGYVSFATDQRFFDIVGLKTPAAIEINRQFSYHGGEEGRGRALAEMAELSGARTILVSEGWNRGFRLVDHLAAEGWTPTPHPAGNPAGLEAYILAPPGG
ncbi:hypothetical protein [Tropicimonas marinistellae]|uniref:hypothetical protein n=1 Tax=Tropicimonas marinistellae TaxID=1739787 RepID=UPI00122DE7E4|nr:hypothetical protein [Tropicimonas marinistellae]